MESISKIFWTQSLSHLRTQAMFPPMFNNAARKNKRVCWITFFCNCALFVSIVATARRDLSSCSGAQLRGNIAHRMYIWRRKIPSLQVAMTCDLKRSKPWTEKLFGWHVCVKSPGVLDGIERLENWDDHHHKQEGTQDRTQQLSRHLSPNPLWKSVFLLPWKKMPRNNWTSTGGYSVRFSSRP